MEIATYKYKRTTGVYPFKKFQLFEMKVEILDDSGKWPQIKFLNYHADGRPPGTVTKVKPSSVKRTKIDECKKETDARIIRDCASRSGKGSDITTYLQNLDSNEIRKPYKDD